MRDRRLSTFAALVLSVILLVALASAAYAQLKTTNVLEAWDYDPGAKGVPDQPPQYTNGNQTLFLNGEPETFYTKFDFDTTAHPDACGAGTSTRWAGDATIGLYHTDNSPQGAPGFESTANWKLVKCSAFGTPPNDNIHFPAGTDILAECATGTPGGPTDKGCVLIGTSDQIVLCSNTGETGNCQDEIQTQFHVNIDPGDGVNPDTKCDGTIDGLFAAEWQADNICLYWEAVKPPAPGWKGNFQVRYGTGVGGDKTINFSDTFYGPNAVGLLSFAGASTSNLLPVGLAVAVFGLVGLVLVRRTVR